MAGKEALTGRVGDGLGISEDITPQKALRNLERALQHNPNSPLAEKMRVRIEQLQKQLGIKK